MKVLITGGAGFIGANFVHYYSKTYPDREIVVLDKLTYAANKDFIKDVPNTTLVVGDICDAELVRKVVRDVDLIIHFAAETHVDNSIDRPADFINTNIVGTFNLLSAARERSVRFHHVSTDEVFGQLAFDEGPWTEESPYSPRSPYSASKASSDHLVRSFFHTYNLPVTISNCSNNYGPYQHSEKLIPKVVSNILSGKKIPVYGKGLNIREWIYVLDHCRGIDLIVSSGKIGETYFIGADDTAMSNINLIKLIIEEMGASLDLIEYVNDRAGHDLRYGIDCSKIKNELGFQTQTDFRSGIRDTINWYCQLRNSILA